MGVSSEKKVEYIDGGSCGVSHGNGLGSSITK